MAVGIASPKTLPAPGVHIRMGSAEFFGSALFYGPPEADLYALVKPRAACLLGSTMPKGSFCGSPMSVQSAPAAPDAGNWLAALPVHRTAFSFRHPQPAAFALVPAPRCRGGARPP